MTEASVSFAGNLGRVADEEEHVAESLSKGSRVVVVELRPSLRWATATTTRTNRIADR